MFEPDEEGETGMRVKQPLASFLAKFKQVHSLGSSLLQCPGILGGYKHCTIVHLSVSSYLQAL